MKNIIRVSAILAIFLSANMLAAQAQESTQTQAKSVLETTNDAELIWAQESAAGNRILVSAYQDGAWQSPEIIVFDKRLHILPTMTATLDGRIAVWSVVEQNETQLYYSVKENGTWQRPSVFKTGFKTNLAPVLVHDAEYTPWLFWSANNGVDNDDIYFSIFKDSQWQAPIKVNADNNVVDNLPQATLRADGRIEVTWQQLQQDEYIKKQRIFNGLASTSNTSSINAPLSKMSNAAKQNLLRLKANKAQAARPDLPASFQSRSRASLYVPKQLPKSDTVDGNIQ